MEDQFGDVEREFTRAVLLWGRGCADALQRVCQWHKDRGDAVLLCVRPAETRH